MIRTNSLEDVKIFCFSATPLGLLLIKEEIIRRPIGSIKTSIYTKKERACLTSNSHHFQFFLFLSFNNLDVFFSKPRTKYNAPFTGFSKRRVVWILDMNVPEKRRGDL